MVESVKNHQLNKSRFLKKNHTNKNHTWMLIGMAIYIMLFIYPVWLGSISSPLYPSQPGRWSLLPFLKTNSSHLKHSQKEAGSSTKTHPFSRANWLLVSGRAREKTLYIPQPIGGSNLKADDSSLTPFEALTKRRRLATSWVSIKPIMPLTTGLANRVNQPESYGTQLGGTL